MQFIIIEFQFLRIYILTYEDYGTHQYENEGIAYLAF